MLNGPVDVTSHALFDLENYQIFTPMTLPALTQI